MVNQDNEPTLNHQTFIHLLQQYKWDKRNQFPSGVFKQKDKWVLKGYSAQEKIF